MFHYENCLLFNLTKAYQKVEGIFKSRLQYFNLTTAQTIVLEALFLEEGLSAGEISKRVSIDNSTLSGILDRLSDAGWITKKLTDDDRRLLEINLTPKALQTKDELLKEIEKTNIELLNNFHTEEKLLLFRMLRDLRQINVTANY